MNYLGINRNYFRKALTACTPTAAGVLPLLDGPLPYPWVAGALAAVVGIQAVNALRK